MVSNNILSIYLIPCVKSEETLRLDLRLQREFFVSEQPKRLDLQSHFYDQINAEDYEISIRSFGLQCSHFSPYSFYQLHIARSYDIIIPLPFSTYWTLPLLSYFVSQIKEFLSLMFALHVLKLVVLYIPISWIQIRSMFHFFQAKLNAFFAFYFLLAFLFFKQLCCLLEYQISICYTRSCVYNL